MNAIVKVSLKIGEFVRISLNCTKRFFKRIWRKIHPDEISAMLDEYGTAMAFGHFFYLKNFVFPDLKKRKERFEYEQDHKIATDKVLFLIPHSCDFYIHDSSRYFLLQPKYKSVAGTYDRKYEVAVLKTKFSQEEYFIVDCPSCLLSISKMKDVSEDISNRLTEEVKDKIRDSFVRALDYLLDNYEGSSKRYQFLYYKESSPEVNALREYWFSNVEHSFEQHDRVVPQPPLKFEYLGASLAYQFYCNYLQRLFPGLRNRMEEWEKEEEVCLAVYKLIILVPYSCYIPKILDESDDNIEFSGKFHLVQEVTTNTKRTYTTTVYKIKAKSSQQENLVKYNNQDKPLQYRACAEFAAPIKQIYTTREECGDLFSKHEMTEQREIFARKLKFLLEEDKDYGHLCDIIEYNDKKGSRKISEVLENYLLKNRDFLHVPYGV